MSRNEGPLCSRRSWMAASGLLVVLAFAAASEEECFTCGDERFPDAVQFLQEQGYPASQFKVLMTWDETSPINPITTVIGYHVLPADGSAPFDLYSDRQGHMLDPDRLADLRISPKDWNLRPAEQLGHAAMHDAAAMGPQPIPISLRDSIAPSAVLELPPIDLAAVLAEDEAGLSTPRKSVTRIGVFQVPATPVTVTGTAANLGAWQLLSDGSRLWNVVIHAPDAIGQRIHFSRIALPAGSRVSLYNAGNPGESYGPYYGPATGETDLWSATCFADAVVVECYAPAGTDIAKIDLAIDRTIHVYRGFEALPWEKSAGSCNLDVACYDDWTETARGVGGVGSVGATGSLWCTGSLLVDTDPATDIPYFLTAHHCVGGQSGTRGASSIEVYWLYQTPSCHGTPQSPASVPRTTGGAQYLAGSAGVYEGGTGNDFTFLRLNNAPPAGLTYLGWSTLPPADGTPITCIHHPHGDFKRISFGTFSNHNPNPQFSNPYPTLYNEVTYDAGTTEPGSSGCPLMISATHQIIGQLWGGDASCTLRTSPDFYGRFDVSFPFIQSYLAPALLYQTPHVDFGASSYTVSETAGSVAITVDLTGPPGGTPAVIAYTISDGTAKAGKNYSATSGTLTLDGTLQVQTFTIPIYRDTHVQGDLTAVITLTPVSGCTIEPAHNSVTLTILDVDVDSDGDGLSDYEEIHATYGYVTDPHNPDTDGDGYTDYQEEMGTLGFVTDPTEFTVLSGLSVPYFKEK